MRTAKWNWVSTLGVAVLAMILSLPLSSQTAWGKDPLTIRLVWKINPTFSALIVAKEKGYYAREGLNLNIGQGAGEKPAIQSVVAGKDEFAFATGLATAKAIDRDVSIIMVANYIKRVPMAVAAHPDIPLRTPKDLEGKRWAASPGDSFISILPTFAKNNNIDINKIERVHVTWAVKHASFMKRDTDLVSVYVTNDLPVLEMKMGKKLNVLPAWEWGYDVLAHGLVTTKSYPEEKADTLRRVIRATSEGFRFTSENPSAVAELLMKSFPAVFSKKGLVEKQVRILNTLLKTKATQSHSMGWQAKTDWERTLTTLERTGEIKNRKRMTAYFTNRYVPE